MKRKLIIASLGLLASLEVLQAQTKEETRTYQLKEVVITGTRTEREAGTLPLPIQIVSGVSIRQSGVSRLNEIIQEQTGLITVPVHGGHGGEGIQMQGLDASYLMILIDGEPLVGRTAGALDLSRISVNNVERIEILKGASSGLYGSEALAGVINIITKNPDMEGKLKLNANYKTATFNTHDASLNIRYGKNKAAFGILGNYFSSAGYNLSENDFSQTVEPYRNFTIQPKLKINFSDKLNLMVNTRFYRQNQDNKAEISGQSYSGNSAINEWNNVILVNHRISERLKLVCDLYVTNYKAEEYLNDSKNQLFEKSEYNQWFYRPEIRSHFTVGKNTLTTGTGMNYEALDRTLFREKAKLNSEYIFAQYEWFIKKKWNVLSGFRYDYHHQYRSQFSPKWGINFKWNDAFSLRTSAGYGYKAPDLRQLYLDFTNSVEGYTVLGYNVAYDRLNELKRQGQILLVNDFGFSQDLKPESSINLNFGGFYQRKKLSFDFNFFYNSISNLIDTRAVAQKTNGKNVFSYFNIDKIFTYGLEVNSVFKIWDNLSLSAGYQYLIAKDQNIVDRLKNEGIFARDPNTLSSFKLRAGEYVGLFNRSAHTANFKVNYCIPSIQTTFYVRVLYRGKYGLFDSNGNTVFDIYDKFIKGYFLTNASASTNFTHGFSLQLGALNVFDYTAKAYIPNLPGRQFFVRIQYMF